MPTTDDLELLREYARTGSEAAFAAIVSRHINMVHSVALRHVRDTHQAEEITQAVFIILSRKAGSLPERTVLAGWLYHAARLTASSFQRSVIRRLRREQEAYEQSRMNENQTTDPWGQMSPLLDEAIASLSESDRDAIVLRFFEGRDFKELSRIFGGTEDGTRMRVRRAVERLRVFLARRGVVLSATVIASVLAANAVQAAPPALLGAVTIAAAKGTALTASSSSLINGTLKIMAWSKLKIAAVTTVSILLTAGTATVVVKAWHGNRFSLASRGNDGIWGEYWNAVTQRVTGTASGPGGTVFTMANDGRGGAGGGAGGVGAVIRGNTGRSKNLDDVIQLMTSHPPMALIRQSSLDSSQRHGMPTAEGSISFSTPLKAMLTYVYDLGPNFPTNYIEVPAEMENLRYDYLDTMANGGKVLLQQALKDQFGLVARRETRAVDALALAVKNPNPRSLHATAPGMRGSGGGTGNSGFSGMNQPFSNIVSQTVSIFGAPVMDETGLTGNFDFAIKYPSQAGLEEIKQAYMDQLGLELTSAGTKQPVEFLVVESDKFPARGL